MPSASLVPVGARSLGAVDGRRHASAEALLPRAARRRRTARADQLPEVLPHGRHRQRRQHHAAPHLLRDARQLLVRRLLQARGDRVRLGALAARASASRAEDIWVTVFEGDDELGLGPDEEAIDAWEEVGRAARADRAVPALGELLAGRARPGRAGRARSCTSTAASSSASRTTSPAARTSASWSTGTSCSCSTTRTRSATLDAAAGARTSTPASGSTAWRRSCRASRSVFETDQFAPLIELGEELSGRALRRGLRRPTARCGSSPTTRAR